MSKLNVFLKKLSFSSVGIFTKFNSCRYGNPDSAVKGGVIVADVSGVDEGHHHPCSSRGDEEPGPEVSGESCCHQLQSADGIRTGQR